MEPSVGTQHLGQRVTSARNSCCEAVGSAQPRCQSAGTENRNSPRPGTLGTTRSLSYPSLVLFAPSYGRTRLGRALAHVLIAHIFSANGSRSSQLPAVSSRARLRYEGALEDPDMRVILALYGANTLHQDFCITLGAGIVGLGASYE